MGAAPDDANLPRATIQRRDTRSYCVLGAMTFDSVTDLWRQSRDMFSGETVLQIDLAQVTHTDSAGLALLVEWMREASRQNARVELLHLPAQMLALADAANLEEALVGKRGSATS
jgi:phospholipid transport system transporter-binding protein